MTPEDLPIGSEAFNRLSQAGSLAELREQASELVEPELRAAVVFLVRRYKQGELGWDSDEFREWETGE